MEQLTKEEEEEQLIVRKRRTLNLSMHQQVLETLVTKTDRRKGPYTDPLINISTLTN